MSYQQQWPNRKLRVLHVANGEYFAGAEQVIMSIGRNLDRDRFSFQLACLMDGPLAEHARDEGFRVTTLPMRNRADLSVVAKLISLIKRYRIQIVHTHTVRSNMVGRVAARLAGVPVVTTVHSPISRDTQHKLKNSANAAVERLSDRWVERYITVSKSLGEELVRNGVSASRVTVVQNGIDVERCQPRVASAETRRQLGIPGEAPVAGMVALFRPRKGAEVLLRASAEVLASLPDLRLVFVGTGESDGQGDYLQRLKDLASELGLADRVVFTGFRDDVCDVLNSLDVLAIPSLFGEGLPIVLLEAMAMAKPVIATPVEGVAEAVIDGETGILVPPGDESALAGALASTLGQKTKAKEMGQAGRALVEREFSVATMTRRIEGVYDEVIGNWSVR
jgi:glycosyltransferase involved in cell wall biosynthesis